MTNEELEELLRDIPHGNWIYHTAGRDNLIGIGIVGLKSGWERYEVVETLCEIVGVREERKKEMIQAARLWTVAPEEMRRLLRENRCLKERINQLEKEEVE